MPNFLVIGAAKAGTTSLYHYLASHPDIFMCPIKEPNFFALEGIEPQFPEGRTERTLATGRVNDLESHTRLFNGVRDERAIGDVSPWYLNSPQAPDRIRHYIPAAKLIVVLRDPAQRAYSAYRMNVRDGHEPCRTFEEALAKQPERQGTWSWGLEVLGTGYYHKHLQRYYERFPAEQIRVYLYEDLLDGPSALVGDVFRFLGVDPGHVPSNISLRYNVSRPGTPGTILRRLLSFGKPSRAADGPMDPSTRAQLIDLYREDIQRLQDLIDRDLSAWMES